MQAGMNGDIQSSSFNASFGDGLGNQLPAFPQAHCIGVELSLLANPTEGPSYHKHGISCLTQAKSFSYQSPSIKQDSQAWAHHNCLCEARGQSMSSTTGTYHACGGGGIVLPSLVKIT